MCKVTVTLKYPHKFTVTNNKKVNDCQVYESRYTRTQLKNKVIELFLKQFDTEYPESNHLILKDYVVDDWKSYFDPNFRDFPDNINLFKEIDGALYAHQYYDNEFTGKLDFEEFEFEFEVKCKTIERVTYSFIYIGYLLVAYVNQYNESVVDLNGFFEEELITILTESESKRSRIKEIQTEFDLLISKCRSDFKQKTGYNIVIDGAKVTDDDNNEICIVI